MVFLNERMLLAFTVSLFISVFLTEKIINFSKRVDFVDKPTEDRKLHKKKIPNLGSISIFIASMFAYFAFSDVGGSPLRPDKLFSITILLFFLGLKDDIEPVKAGKRLMAEFLCAFFIIYITDIRILSMYGVFGITDLPYWGSFVLTSIFIVACINAYNMIDGIDGLLGSLSLVGTIIFAILFYSAGEWLWALLSIVVAGSLIGFLIYNWQPASIFMGNGGSMFLGTIFACVSLRVMQLGTIEGAFFTITMPHTIVLGVISIPIFDMLSVFSLRIYHGISPFKADNRHTHHRLLRLGLSHWQTVLILVFANILILALAYYVQERGALRSLVYTFLFCCLLEAVLIFFHWKKLGRH
jgi:UDP-N-acetylmuramyl pentapeptide phosphotransferase/UDP-N-acetylglucosamine-1-phosphate transferase